jgi:hypothetical protein
MASRGRSAFNGVPDNGSVDLAADSTNQTLAQELPVAEKLRLNRYIDRKGTNVRCYFYGLNKIVPYVYVL